MSFLNRWDTKFVLKMENVQDFLDNIAQNYSLLQINETVIQSYKTVYFDTPDLLCFNMHHNKRANRFKFRTRKYLSNGKIFNEIKQKLNTGKTIKYRQKRLDEFKFEEFDNVFLTHIKNYNYNIENLVPSLFVFFNRITFLNKNFPERMTLDFGLKYEFNNERLSLNNTAIIELKKEKGPDKTFSQDYLHKVHINPGKFSKYTIGISLTHPNAKKNRFLPKLKKLSYERSITTGQKEFCESLEKKEIL